ncbi:MAG: hypothetical protein FWC39_10895 [Bacteroidetes bacterium]|nr:hypothetical protein [Bacteroidota bacterium]
MTKINFLKICLLIALGLTSVVFNACKKNEPNKTTDDKTSTNAESTQRYETVPYVESSNLKSGELDNLVFTDYDDEFNYYFFVLGHVKSMPLAYRSAVYYNGVTSLTLKYSQSDVTQESIKESVTDAKTYSIATSHSTTYGNDLGVAYGIATEAEVGTSVPSLSAKVKVATKFEASYKHSWGGSEGTATSNVRSFSNTYETSRAKTSTVTKEESYVLGNNGEPAGMYRWSLFSTADVYFVVITDRAKTRIVETYTAFCARPTQYWEIDYEPERGSPFGKTASGALLEIPNVSLAQLPDRDECQHDWGAWTVITAPTFETEGEESRTCKLCGKTETRAITVTSTGTFDLTSGRWTNGSGNATFSTNTNILTVNDGANIVITGSVNDGKRIVVNGMADITLYNVSITGLATDQSPILLNSGANLKLTIEGNNILKAGANCAGIQVPNGTTLIIDGKGNLTTVGGSGGAGIGGGRGSNGAPVADKDNCKGTGNKGNNGGDGGTIIIHSGTVTAEGGDGAAGIGGGRGGNGSTGASCQEVNASGGNGGAGGSGGNGGSFTISGGIVYAIGNGGGADIGGGRGGNGGQGGAKSSVGAIGNKGGDGGKGGNGGNRGSFTNNGTTVITNGLGISGGNGGNGGAKASGGADGQAGNKGL